LNTRTRGIWGERCLYLVIITLGTRESRVKADPA
jgi:hypothetical protein